MKITLGFSPCPNDTFIFDALVNKKIDTKGFDFEVRMEDVQTLNQLAIANRLDMTKVSYGVLNLLLEDYIVLNSGSALGSGVGPLVIGRTQLKPEEVKNYIIALPGENTTAHLLFKLAFPAATNKIFVPYNEIEDLVLNSEQNNYLGVIIHENRFTYEGKGLKKIIDLGAFWETQTGSPIPLGGIVAKRSIDRNMLKDIDGLIRESIEYSFKNYPKLTPYIREHAQEMNEDVMRMHIDLYVNEFSLDLGEKGKSAIKVLLGVNNNDKINQLKGEMFLE